MKSIIISAFIFVALANEIHGSSLKNRPQICKPGESTRVDCNTCTCSLDGTQLGCTRMACPKIPPEYLNPDGTFRVTPVRPDNPLLRGKRDQICKPGTTRNWDCNTCHCSKDGTQEACTRKFCVDLPRQRRDLKCKPNESFMDDCNHCLCSADGRAAACTLMACVGPPLRQLPNQLARTKRSADQVCEPNTSKIWECNRCRCSSDGTKEFCTRRVCPIVPRHKRDIPLQCTPNKSFMQDCNTCFCSADGRFAGCTLMACPGIHTFPILSDPTITTRVTKS